MLSEVYRFNYNSDTQNVDYPSNDPIPEKLVNVILANRFLIEQDSFELLRMFFEHTRLVIQKFIKPSLVYKGVSYYYTLRLTDYAE